LEHIRFQHVFRCHSIVAWFFELFPRLFRNSPQFRAILSFIICFDECNTAGFPPNFAYGETQNFGRAPTLRHRRNGDSDTQERASRSSMSATRDCPLASNQHAVIGPLYVTSSIRTAPAKNSNRAPGRPAGWAGERRYNSHFRTARTDNSNGAGSLYFF